ncbi:MAG: type 4b pilus protein PilO2 [Roseibium sp.]|uniref:type 4b pilus protein PilO2 n=1 Tax=Roseibium sp. TaxID=1936156 RepID=UPI00329A2C4B
MSDQKKDLPPEDTGEKKTKKSLFSGLLGQSKGKKEKVKKTKGSAADGDKKPSGLAGLLGSKKKTKAKAKNEEVAAGDILDIPKGMVVDLDVMNDGVVQVGKTKAAMALSWRSFNANQKIKDQAETAAASGRSADYNLYLDTRATGLIAFGSGEIGHKRGMKALITMIDERYTGPRWLAAFKMGETNPVYWIAAKRGGEVFEDQVVGDPETAREIILGEIDAPDWTRIIAPEDWGIKGTVDASLSDVVNHKIGQSLKPVRPIKANLPRIIAAIVIVAAASYGYARWQGLKIAEIERLQEIRRMERESVRVTPKDYPWFEVAKIEDFIDTCVTEIQKDVYSVTGWGAAPIACVITRGDGVISTSWQRQIGGRISWLKGAMPADYPDVRLDANGSQANFNRTFRGPFRPDALADENWSGNRIQDTLVTRFQNLDLPLVLNEVVQRQARNRRNDQKAVFNHHIAQVRTDMPINEFGKLLSDIPALAPETLIYTPAENSWSLIFKVYHPPILPAEN